MTILFQYDSVINSIQRKTFDGIPRHCSDGVVEERVVAVIHSRRRPARANRQTGTSICRLAVPIMVTGACMTGAGLVIYQFGLGTFMIGGVILRYRRQESRFPTGAAIDRLSADLGLAHRGQDWELLAADSRRVIEFLDYYDTRQLNDDERFTLMSLIIASFDERLSAGQDDVSQDRIVARLTARFDVLNYLVQYWALPDEDGTDDAFNFTPIARQIMQSKYGDRENWPRTPIAIKRAKKLLPEQGINDFVEIADNRDGTFELAWSKIAERDFGSREFSSIDEATEFARSQFGVAVDAWCEFK